MGEEPDAAPEMETVAITRAFKAAAAVMGFGCFLMAVITTGATSWSTVMADDTAAAGDYYTSGLFQKCLVSATPDEKVETEGNEMFKCEVHKEAAPWRSACQALIIVGDLAVLVAFVLLTVGICSVVARVKFALYKVAITGYLIAVVLFVTVLIVYPTMALSPHKAEDVYALGWVYVLAWVNTGLIFACALAVIIDKGEELTEREKVLDEEEGEEE